MTRPQLDLEYDQLPRWASEAMLTGAELMRRIGFVFPSAIRQYAFPFTYVEIVEPGLPKDFNDREELVAGRLRIEVPKLRSTCNRLFVRLEIRCPDEVSQLPSERGHFWMRSLQVDSEKESANPACPAVHFYGYKGGQGRSSLLAFVSLILANDGWQVLVLDMDAEAPSLNIMYNAVVTDAGASLVGLRGGEAFRPLRVHSAGNGGLVDLLAFRPEGEMFDLDAAALSMEMSIHPPSQSALITKVRQRLQNYDVVLIDHRTGLAPTVLPWIVEIPGPVAAFARMDGQWRCARRHVIPLWRVDRKHSGILISALPANESDEEFTVKHEAQALELLDQLALATGAEKEEQAASDDCDAEIAGSDLLSSWILWPYDSTFGLGPVPEPSSVSGLVHESIARVRRLLGLVGKKERPPLILHPSGGSDEGHLIQTRALRELKAPNNQHTYILGRKGTGKTRLVRALAEIGRGQPLLVPAEMPEAVGGVIAEDPSVQLLAATSISDVPHEYFWWTLIDAALDGSDTSRQRMRDSLAHRASIRFDVINSVRSKAVLSVEPRVLLIDGLETAFSRELTFPMLAALFRVAVGVDADPLLRGAIQLRIFIRTDLAQRGFENFEQQSYGRILRLSWDSKSILNFALSRIERLGWFDTHFPTATQAVRKNLPALLQGSLSEEECDALLLNYFPARLNHANINTSTFLRSWFSDDPKAENSFYPRVYDEFLRTVAGEGREDWHGPETEGIGTKRRLAPQLIYHAHAMATQRFLEQVRTELRNVVELDDPQLTDLLDAMKGSITPFVLDKLVEELAKKTSLSDVLVRRALERMKGLGIFEDRPGFPGRQWRVGRLFKSSLGMKYNRIRSREAGEIDEV